MSVKPSVLAALWRVPIQGGLALVAIRLLLGEPVAAQTDPRLVTHQYDATEVVRINGRVGVQATITFEDNETIENVAVGDSQKWQITPNKRANLLFVKPIEVGAYTNMTVVTNRRTYLFDLIESSKVRPVYMFQFTYSGEDSTPAIMAAAASDPAPEPPSQSTAVAAAKQDTAIIAVPAEAPPPASAATVVPAPVNIIDQAIAANEPVQGTPVPTSADRPARPARTSMMNFAWSRKGDAELFPLRIYDDGRATYLTWRSPKDIPDILSGGDEPLNYAVSGASIAIDHVPSRITLRRGDERAILDNLRENDSQAYLMVPAEQPVHPFSIGMRARLASAASAKTAVGLGRN